MSREDIVSSLVNVNFFSFLAKLIGQSSYLSPNLMKKSVYCGTDRLILIWMVQWRERHYGLGSIPGPGVTCRLSLLLVLVVAPTSIPPGPSVLLPPHTPAFQIPNCSGIVDKKSHLVQFPLAKFPVIQLLIHVFILSRGIFFRTGELSSEAQSQIIGCYSAFVCVFFYTKLP